MENQNYGSVIGSSSAPFINALAATGTTISNYHSYGQGIGGCSAGCYEAFTAGQQHVSDSWCPRASSPCSSEANIADQLNAAGLSSAMFCEDGCPRGADHFPWIGYTSTWNSCMTGSFTCTGQTGPDGNAIYGSSSSNGNTVFINYLNSANPANYIWFTPTDSHNMHDNSVSTGDSYLKNLLIGTGTIIAPSSGSLLATNLLKQSGTFVYLWWDEYDPSPNVERGTMVKIGHTSTGGYTEYDSLHTIEANFGLPYITSLVAGDSGMTDIFGTTIPPPPQQLTASFTHTPNSPIAGSTVSFAATATGGASPFTYSWSFGDGATSTGQSPSHTYVTAGSDTVTLTVTDSSGQSAKSMQTLTVTSVTPPQLSASFNYSPAMPNTGQTVTFTASASGGTSPYSLSWNFGDGSTATGSSTTHAFSSAGTFTVILTVKDSSSTQQTTTSQQTLTIPSPLPIPTLTASFHYSPSAPTAGQQVSLTASTTGGTTPYSYSWSFGDGSTGTGTSITHTYITSGSFPVILTVRDSGTPQQSATSQLTIPISQTIPASGTNPTYTLTFQGFDWDGGHEETLTLNGNTIARLPNTDSPQNQQIYVPFSLNITSFVTAGTNTLVISHANWDCGVIDSVENLQIISQRGNQTTTIYSNITPQPLSCTQKITDQFTTTPSGNPPPANPPPTTKPTYTISWLGYDWDGGHEETLILNGQRLMSLPLTDSPQNQRIFVPFSYDITSLVKPGINTLTIVHANWDCAVIDTVENMQVTMQVGNQTTIVYSDMAAEPLSCTQQVTYTFAIPSA